MIKHFVGEEISVSLMEPQDNEPYVRLAREDTPGEYLDMTVKGFHELQEVLGMMQHAMAARNPIGQLLGAIVNDQEHDSEE